MPLDEVGGGDRKPHNVLRFQQIRRSPEGHPLGGNVDATAAFAHHKRLLERAASIALGGVREFKEGARATLQLESTRHSGRLGDRNADGAQRPETVEAILQIGGAIFTVGRFEGSRFVPSALLVQGRAEARYYDDPRDPQTLPNKFTKIATAPRVSGLDAQEGATLRDLMEGLVGSASGTRTRVAEAVHAFVG